MKYFILTIGILLSITLRGQDKQYVYYFDKDLNVTGKEMAVYYGMAQTDGDLLRLMLYTFPDKQLVGVQHFTDSSLQVREGLFTSFYANGNKESEGDYANNKQEGWWQKRDSSAKYVIDSSLYEKGMIISFIHRGYYKSGYPESVVINNMNGNELRKIYYDDSGKLSYDVHFIGNNGQIRNYNSGVVSIADSVFTRDEIEASFPGGADAWTRYIIREVSSHAQEVYASNTYGTCIVKFIIDTTGKLIDIAATTMPGTELAKVAVKIIKNSPRWSPASQYGRKVNAHRRQDFTITAPK